MNKTDLIKRSLLQNGHAKVEYPEDLRIAVEKVYQAWMAFCAQSINHKEMLPFEKNGGYENKDRRIDPTSRDHKEDFHITRYYDLPKSFNAKKTDTDLIDSGKFLFEKITPSLVQVAYILSEITGVDFAKLAVEKEDGWVLRLLHYYPGNMDQIPAHYHPDKGGHTFHLFDSTPGFEKYWDGKWSPLRFKHNEMVFFPGLLGQYHSKCKLKALSHRVASSPEIIQNGRYSLVLFNDYATSDVTYDKETWGPTQEAFIPGGNYDMDFEIFEKYFKKRIQQDAR